MEKTYPAIVTEDNQYHLKFVDFPNINVTAGSEDELIERAMVSLDKYLLKQFKRRKKLPTPTDVKAVFLTYEFIGIFIVETSHRGYKVANATTIKTKETIEF